MAETSVNPNPGPPTEEELAAIRDQWAKLTPELSRHTWLGHEFRAVNMQGQLVTATLEHVRYLIGNPPPIPADAQPAEKAPAKKGKSGEISA